MSTAICYQCDSMLNETCEDDSLLDNFSKKCEVHPSWCYVAKGMVNVLIFQAGSLMRVDVNKTVRGCTRPRNREDCVRVKQAHGISNFTVCSCNTTECNGNSSRETNISIFLEDSSENLRTSRILAITWLCIMLIGPAFSNFGVNLQG